MIKALTLQNFQSHKDNHIELSPGVNIIIGPSDSGKTAIIRALRWAIFNRPQGDHFRSHWGGCTSVEIELDNHTIIRKKDKGDEYILDEASFKAFRSDIPDEIIKAFNINEINLQMQLDAPFLLNDSSGSVAQHFNRVAKLEKIDTGRQNIESWIRQITSDINYKEADIEKHNQSLVKFEHLAKFEADVETLEQLDNQYNNMIKSLDKLKGLIKNIQNLNCDLQEYTVLLELEEPVNSILSLYKQHDAAREQSQNLDDIIKEISDCNTNIANYTVLFEMEPDIDRLLGLYSNIKEIQKEKVNLNNIIESIQTKDIRINRAKKLQEEKQQEFDINFPDLCPLCGEEHKTKDHGNK